MHVWRYPLVLVSERVVVKGLLQMFFTRNLVSLQLLSELISEISWVTLVIPCPLVPRIAVSLMDLRHFVPLHLLLDHEHHTVLILKALHGWCLLRLTHSLTLP